MTLRAVKAGEAAPVSVEAPEPVPTSRASKPRAKTVLEAATSGDRRALLVAMRSRAARAVQNPKCSPRDLSTLMRQLLEISQQIEEIDSAAKAQEDDGVEDVEDEDFDPSTL